MCSMHACIPVWHPFQTVFYGAICHCLPVHLLYFTWKQWKCMCKTETSESEIRRLIQHWFASKSQDSVIVSCVWYLATRVLVLKLANWVSIKLESQESVLILGFSLIFVCFCLYGHIFSIWSSSSSWAKITKSLSSMHLSIFGEKEA